MATARYTIIYERDGNRYKVVRVLIGEDGSYYVTCPYHVSEKVSLTKRIVNYPNPDSRAEDAPIELAVLEDDDHRLKLSHHPDGFVQFSGHGVRSGKHEDGTPKGLGLQSFRLDRPTAGPAVSVTILGPTAFEVARKERTEILCSGKPTCCRQTRTPASSWSCTTLRDCGVGLCVCAMGLRRSSCDIPRGPTSNFESVQARASHGVPDSSG